MNYKEQVNRIKKLTKSINKKSAKFVKSFDSERYPYCGDLLRVIKDLEEAENFLK